MAAMRRRITAGGSTSTAGAGQMAAAFPPRGVPMSDLTRLTAVHPAKRIESGPLTAPALARDPHTTARQPGGPSSGSAAGVADRMIPLGFGTQTAGSIIRPASFCGVVGYKPSFGTIAIAGTKALAESFDTIGGFGTSIADVALFVATLAGRPSLMPGEPHPKPRIGFFRTAQWAKAEPACQRTLETTAQTLSRAGALVSDPAAVAPLCHIV